MHLRQGCYLPTSSVVASYLCILSLTAACTKPHSATPRDTVPPEATVAPAEDAVLGPHASIVVSFSESMDVSSLQLSGGLGAESDGGAWSSTRAENDTLTLSPSAQWSSGTSRSLSVAARDLAGNPLALLTRSYTVDAVAPTATATPDIGSILGPDTNIVVLFTESIDTSSLSLTGALASQSAAPQWTSTNVADDTLTLVPATTWSDGDGGLSVAAADLVGNTMAPLSLAYGVDAIAPTATVAPQDGSRISGSQQLVISFSEAMTPVSLSLGGSLASESDGGVWGSNAWSNDTLVLTPSSLWTEGTGSVTVNADDVRGNPLVTLSLTLTVDRTLPTATVVPSNGTHIQPDAPIVIRFSESMNPATLALSGTLVSESDGGSWTANTSANDTLTVSPATLWSEGLARSLQIDASDVVGNAVAQLSLSYVVDGTAPTVAAQPGDASTIGASDPIVLTFDESVEPSSLQLTGSLASESDGGTFSSSTLPNDTLTLTPASAWSGGAATLSVALADLAGNTMTPATFSYDVDVVAPTWSCNTASGATVGRQHAIVVTFSESMGTGSVQLSGTLASSASSSWSTTTLTNDTLTIAPVATYWPGGNGKTLGLTADDLVGNPMAPALSLTLDVDATMPIGTSVPGPNATIPVDQIIVFTFSESIDRTNLTIGGALALEMATPVWSTTNVVDDTLTIAPKTTWTQGTGKDVTLHIADLVGNTNILKRTYTVDSGPPSIRTLSPDKAKIRTTDWITIWFDETVNPATLVLGGTMGAEATVQGWINNIRVDIKPTSGSWTAGPGRTFTVDVEDTAGNAMTPQYSHTYDVDGSPPQLLSQSPSSTLGPTTPIVLVWSESLDSGLTVILNSSDPANPGGGMGDETSQTPIWSSTNVANDTTTLIPTTTWSDGSNRMLSMNVYDEAMWVVTVTLTFTVDATAATATPYPASGTTLTTNTDAIVVIFNESMDTASMSLSGTMAAEATTSWSMTASANDTLTIFPSSVWSAAVDRSLDVSVADLVGNPTVVNLTYTVP